MSKGRTGFAAVAIAVLLTGGVAIGAAGSYTMGDFVAEFAARAGIDGATPHDALEGLRDAGYAVDRIALDVPATEGAVADFARAAGLRVTSSRPNAPFDRGLADAFFQTFHREIAGADGSDPSAASSDSEEGENRADPLTKGKGKKKGLLRSPSEPI